MSNSLRRFTLILIAAALTASGCTSPEGAGKEGVNYHSGSADSFFEIFDVGPLNLEEADEVEITTRIPAYRVESYGDTTLALDLTAANADPLIVVEDAEGNIVASDDDGGEGLNSRLTVTLTEPGLYRVIAGTYETLSRGSTPEPTTLNLEARCQANCARPSMSAAELLTQLRANGELELVEAMLTAQLEELLPDSAMRAAAINELQTILASEDFAGIERFPALPLRGLGQARPLMGLLPEVEPSEDVVVEGELARVLGVCQDDRTDPGPLNPALPSLLYGHYPNRALTPCQVSHSEGLARALTALAADNGSSVTYNGQTLTTPRELFAALLATGHSIEVRNERTYANFTGLSYNGLDVVWPVWVDVGEEVGGGPLLIPSGHSHHAWRVEGPDVNARVMFYLGISGAAFFAQTSTRPGWCGEVLGDRAFSDDEAEHILATVDAATAYLQRIRTERTTVAAGMPADGYGFVGVCNDSNAVIEYVTRGTISAFPLMRAAELDDAPLLDDGLDEALRALPHDADVSAGRADTLRRVMAMTPHELDSDQLVDEMLRQQLLGVQSELAGQ